MHVKNIGTKLLKWYSCLKYQWKDRKLSEFIKKYLHMLMNDIVKDDRILILG